jgi:CubicO group peptidase (beta-lactamase class C family)
MYQKASFGYRQSTPKIIMTAQSLARRFVFTVTLGIFSGTIQAATPSTSKTPSSQIVQRVVQEAAAVFMKNPAAVGLSIGVVDRGRGFRFNYGEISPGSGERPTSDTVYDIGSITKSFTALLLAHAVAEQKIGLNDDIRRYLKGTYPNLQYADGQPVKVAYLLAHIAQFPRNTSKPIDSNFTEKDFENELRAIKLDMVQPLHRQNVSMESYHYEYSNFGYQVLGVLLENAYGKSYSDLLRQYITGPWKMPSTLVYAQTEGLIKGYDAQHHPMPEGPALYPAAGGLRSNVDDLLKYVSHQLQEDDPFVRMTHRLLLIPANDSDGWAWTMGRTRNWNYYLREDGGTKGFRTFIAMFPDEQIGVVLLSNETDEQAGRRLYDLTNAIFDGLCCIAK